MAARVHANNPSVSILICTYNGEKYLRAQIDSIVQQTYLNWVIFVSDDGSNDSTLKILQSYQSILGKDRFYIFNGPQKGFSKNFISLLKRDLIKSEYYAFSDQDDIWSPDKIDLAIAKLELIKNNRGKLYCSRTSYVDNNLRELGKSPLFRKRPSFQNALVQSIAGGNTMVLDNRARDVILSTCDSKPIISHDWWCYLAVTAAGGEVIYDATPHIGYRQHGKNLVGANSSIKERAERFKKMLFGTFSHWNHCNLDLLKEIEFLMPEENKRTYYLFSESREGYLLKRLTKAYKSRVYRQTFLGNIGLILAYLIKKV